MLTFRVGYVANQLKVHRNTVTNWIKKGRLRATPATAKQYTISKSDFMAFCDLEQIPQTVVNKLLEALWVPENPDSGNGADTFFPPPSEVPIPDGHPLDLDRSDQSGADGDNGNGKMRDLADVDLPGDPLADLKGDSGDSVIMSADLRRLPASHPVVGAVLVVGGGVAGIQAALDLAEDGYRVFVVEREAGIGGSMAQLEKTFPTNECAPCILLPRLVKCVRHPDIELITLSEVHTVEGQAGNFTVTLKLHPRFIDPEKCTGCGICAERCPVASPDHSFHAPFGKKAVYLKYDHSVPLKYAIDPDLCLFFTFGKCRACETCCPTDAVNFMQVEERRTIEVGAIILASGTQSYKPMNRNPLGYGTIPDVLTAMEFENALTVSSPGRGTLRSPFTGKSPRSIAWIQCVGSRNRKGGGHSYCSNICCIAAVKQSIAAEEHSDVSPLERVIFYLDFRNHGKGSERFFQLAKSKGVRFVRALPHALVPGEEGRGIRLRYLDERGDIHMASFDMVVLSTGMAPHHASIDLARKCEIDLDPYRFVSTSSFAPIQSSRRGIYTIGAFQAPKAIHRSVIQASASALAVSEMLSSGRNTVLAPNRVSIERNMGGNAPAIGIFICSCGVAIANSVDVHELAEDARTLPFVKIVVNTLFSCSAAVQQLIVKHADELQLDRIVIAACTPRTHESLFQETLKEAGLNGYMVEMANIRNHNAWVHQKESEKATQKAKVQVRMAVAKIIHARPLKDIRISVVQRALIIGGGITGMVCALAIARRGIPTLLVEKSGQLGGNALQIKKTFKGESVLPVLNGLIFEVDHHDKITVYRRSVMESITGSVGNFEGVINTRGDLEHVNFGAAIIATGAKEAEPDEYLYGDTQRIMTQLEFDNKVLHHPAEVEKADAVVFIQCVGSREPQRPYCSRICCIHTVTAAITLKEMKPDLTIYVLYRDLTTYGQWEEVYTKARQLGVSFIRYDVAGKPTVTKAEKGVTVEVFTMSVHRTIRMEADYLVLASGVMPGDNPELVKQLSIDPDPDGFFKSAHHTLSPLELSVPGFYIAGLCHYPQPMDESIEDAEAVAFKLSTMLSKGEIVTDPIKAYVTRQCHRCGFCIDVCPFQAISMKDHTIEIDPMLCRGCGICAGTCPNDGIRVHGFTREQLMAQMNSAVHLPVI